MRCLEMNDLYCISLETLLLAVLMRCLKMNETEVKEIFFANILSFQQSGPSCLKHRQLDELVKRSTL